MTALVDFAPQSRRALRRNALAAILTAAALIVALSLLLQSTLGLGPGFLPRILAGWAIGSLFFVQGLARHHPHASLGAANAVTLLRGCLVMTLASLVAEGTSPQITLTATALATLAAALDSLDGWLARRQATQSDFGARFDMETDALLILALAVLIWQSQRVGSWVLACGLLRYLFVAASALLPWLRQPLPASQRRKAIAALQMVLLITALAPFVPAQLAIVAALLAVLSLALSFGLDCGWLWRQRH